MQILYVPCKVSTGFFESEFYVIVGDSSAFVDERSVKFEKAPAKGQEIDGFVSAYLVKEEDQRALVELPGQPVVGGLRTWVPKATLTTV